MFRFRLSIGVIFLILGLIACGGQVADEVEPQVEAAVSDPAPAEEAQVEQAQVEETAVSTPIPPTPSQSKPEEAAITTTEAAPLPSEPFNETVAINGADGLSLQATLYGVTNSAPRPGVILLHMLNSRRDVWADTQFAEALVDAGYVALAVDMRGHGETGGSKDWDLAAEDLKNVWKYLASLPAVDDQHTAVIGGSIGSNMALVTGANLPPINTVILLSPGLDYLGVTTDDQVVIYGERPLLIVASEEDGYAARSSRELIELALGDSHLEMYNGAGHGTNMFNAKPELTTLMIDWLDQYTK